ncbi:MAG: two-component system C4-dicarboxylate transport sensor histidine kinase DctB [Sulfurimonas sp.]
MNYNFKFIIGFFVLLYAIITLLFFNFYKELAIKDTKQEAISILSTMTALSSYLDEIQRPIMNELRKKTQGEDNFFDVRVHSSYFIEQYIY